MITSYLYQKDKTVYGIHRTPQNKLFFGIILHTIKMRIFSKLIQQLTLDIWIMSENHDKKICTICHFMSTHIFLFVTMTVINVT